MAENYNSLEVEELEPPRRQVASSGEITPRVTRDPLVKPAAGSRLTTYLIGGVTVVALAIAGVLLVLDPADLLEAPTPSGTSSDPAAREAPVSPVASVPYNDALLTVRTTPRGATMTVDAVEVGSSPLQSMRFAAGDRAVGVRMDGYAPIDTVVTLAAGDNRQLSLALQPLEDAEAAAREDVAPDVEEDIAPDVEEAPETFPATVVAGFLDIASEPSGAAVFIDGERVGVTPLRGHELPPGVHQVTFEQGNHETATQTVEVDPGETSHVSQTLEARYGTARLLALPWGSIFVDGELLFEETDLRHTVSLPAGTHVVRAEHPVLGSIEREVRVLPDADIDVILDFNQ